MRLHIAGLLFTASVCSGEIAKPEEKIIWTEFFGRKIQRANLDGSNVEELLTSPGNPRGIDVDGSGDLYWASTEGPSGGAIYSASFEGSTSQVLILLGGFRAPFGVGLDVPGGKVYWCDQTDFPEGGRIGSAQLDGSLVEIVIDEGRVCSPGAMAVEPVLDRMCWSEGCGEGALRCSDSGGENIVSIAFGTHSLGVALDPVNRRLFWTDYEAGELRRANLDGSNGQVLLTGLTAPFGIAVDPSRGKWQRILDRDW